ncbi:hypothetical protein [Haloarcula sp. K1]|uniref:hypothetical protein n=1 Tax=Haloarcula sp. K1 TaxID=1622207 RepID=UPI0007BB925B|nr:hypothetical protein [Haloarcula sp. K1]KZX46342.1 hypothetical protein AV929_16360 [Haloarcula sp. K1]
MNEKSEKLLVGRSPNHNRKSYRLYHSEAGDFGFAGKLIHEQTFGQETEHRVGFVPAGDTPGEETVVEAVSSLEVLDDGRTTELDNVLPRIRTALTDSDWSSGCADTGYGEWIQAVNLLADYLNESYNEGEIVLSTKAVMQAKVMHAIARYPLSAEDLLSQTANSFNAGLDEGVYEASPMALRAVLLAYADEEAQADES